MYTRLSELVETIEPTNRKRFITRYRNALKDGMLKAVLLDERFEVEFAGRSGPETKSILDEALKKDNALENWIAETNKHLNAPKKSPIEKIAVSFNQLLDDSFDFDAKALQNQKRFSKGTSKKKRK